MANHAKKSWRHLDKMNVATWFDFVLHFAYKNKYWCENLFAFIMEGFDTLSLFVSPVKQGQHIGIMTLASSSAASTFWSSIDNFWRDASISF